MSRAKESSLVSPFLDREELEELEDELDDDVDEEEGETPREDEEEDEEVELLEDDVLDNRLDESELDESSPSLEELFLPFLCLFFFFLASFLSLPDLCLRCFLSSLSFLPFFFFFP